jgi:DNA-binding transcriptional MerR regulator
MPLNEDQLRHWEHIIAEVSKTDVPLECIKKVLIKLRGGRQRTVNVTTLKNQGLSIDEIGAVLTRTLDELDDSIRDVDFVIDIQMVAEILQPTTDKLLEKLKK